MKAVSQLPRTPMRKVVCGSQYSAAVTLAHGDLYMWGNGTNGQLGVGDESNVLKPTLVATNVIDISCHTDHTVFLDNLGHVYSCGGGRHGKLGHNDETGQSVPMRINALNEVNVQQVATGLHHSAAVTAEGRVYTWGKGENGRLGHNCYDDVFEPQLVLGLENVFIVSAALGDAHSVFLSYDGHVYTCGDGSYGELGFPGFDLSVPRRVPGLTNVINVVCGSNHTLVLIDDGSVASFGLNSHGQLGYTADSLVKSSQVKSTDRERTSDTDPLIDHTESSHSGTTITLDVRTLDVVGSGPVEYAVRPQRIPSVNGAWHIAAFGDRSAAVCSDGVLTWGDASVDGLGHGKQALKTPKLFTPTLMQQNGHAWQVALGRSHMMFLLGTKVTTDDAEDTVSASMALALLAKRATGPFSPPSSPSSSPVMSHLELHHPLSNGALTPITPTISIDPEVVTQPQSLNLVPTLPLLPRSAAELEDELSVINEMENSEPSYARKYIQLMCKYEQDVKLVLLPRQSSISVVRASVWKAFKRSLLINHEWTTPEGHQIVAQWSAPSLDMVLQRPDQKCINVHLSQGTIDAVTDVKMCTDSDLRQRHHAMITCIVRGNGRTIFTGDKLGVIRGWKTNFPGSCTHVLRGHSDCVNGMILMDSAMLVSVSDDRTVRMWNLRTMENVHTATCDDRIKCVASDDKGRVLTGHDSGVIVAWFVSSHVLQETAELTGLGASVNKIVISGNHCYATGGDAMHGVIGFWKLDQPAGAPIALCEGHSATVTDITVVSTVIYSVSPDKTIRAWNPVVGLCRRDLQLQVEPLCLAATSELLFIGCKDGHIFAYSAAEFLSEESYISPEYIFAGHRDQVNCLTLHETGADGLLLLSGSGYMGEDRPPRDCSVCVWDAKTGDLLRRLHGHTAPITLIGPGPSNMIYSCDAGGRACQWNPKPSSSDTELNNKEARTDFNLVFSSFGDMLRYTVKPRGRVPIDYVKSLVDFIQLASFPFLLSLPWSPSAAFFRSFMQVFVLEIEVPSFIWIVSVAIFLALFFAMYIGAPTIQFQRVRHDNTIGHPMNWSVIWMICWSVIMLGSTMVFLPLVRSAVTILACEKTGFIRQNSEVVCWSSDHMYLLIFSALILLLYLPLCLRLAGVDGDISRVNQTSLFRWGQDDPDTENIHGTSVRSFLFHRALAIVKVLSAFAAVFDIWIPNLSVAQYLQISVFSISIVTLMAIIVIDRTFYRQRFNLVRFASFAGVLFTDFVSYVVVIVNDPKNDIPPLVYYAMLVLVIGFGAWLGNVLLNIRTEKARWNIGKRKGGIKPINTAQKARTYAMPTPRTRSSTSHLVRRMSSLFMGPLPTVIDDFDVASSYSASSYCRTAVVEAAEILSTSLLGQPSLIILGASPHHEPASLNKALNSSFGATVPVHAVSSLYGVYHGSQYSSEKDTSLVLFGISDPAGIYVSVSEVFDDGCNVYDATHTACKRAMDIAERKHYNSQFSSLPFPGPSSAVIVSHTCPIPSRHVLDAVCDSFPDSVILGDGMSNTEAYNFFGKAWAFSASSVAQFQPLGDGVAGIVITLMCTSVKVHAAFMDSGHAPTAYVARATKTAPGRIVELDGRSAKDVYGEWVKGSIIGREPDVRTPTPKHRRTVRSPSINTSGRIIRSVSSQSPYSRRKKELTLAPSDDHQISEPEGLARLVWFPIGHLQGRDVSNRPYFCVTSTYDDMHILGNVEVGTEVVLMKAKDDVTVSRHIHVVRKAMDFVKSDANIAGVLLFSSVANTASTSSSQRELLAKKSAELLNGKPSIGVLGMTVIGRHPSGRADEGSLMITAIVFSKYVLISSH